MHNVVKHARATQVWLDVQVTAGSPDGGPQVVLSVRDDGRGFDPQAITHGLGLRGIRERTERVSGQLYLEAAAGRGTVLRVTVPIHGRTDNRDM